MRKLFANRKTRYRNLAIVLLPFAALMIFSIYLVIKSAKDTISGATSRARKSYLTIEKMDYHLRHNATDLQKELFKDLKNAAESENSSDVVIAELVAKNFVADFFTWTNKEGQADVGGLYYVYSPQKILIFRQARDSFYHYVSTYMDKYGKENLLEVESVETVAAEMPVNQRYTIEGVSYPTYGVSAKWKYKDNPQFDEEKYSTHSTLLLIKNTDNRFEIVQMYGGD